MTRPVLTYLVNKVIAKPFNDFIWYAVKTSQGNEENDWRFLPLMQKVLEQSGIRGVYIINNQISHAFRKKIPYLQEVFKNAGANGENVRKSY